MLYSSATAALDEIEVFDDWCSIAHVVRGRDRLDAKLVRAIGAYDAGGEWAIDGWTSVAAQLRDIGVGRREANELQMLATKLRRLPVTLQAWIDGDLTGGQVRVICALVIERHVARFAEHEDALVPELAELSTEDTWSAMQTWRARADALDDGPEPDDSVCEARLSPMLDNKGLLTATLDAEGYALANEALRIADSEDFEVPTPQRRGQALKDIFAFFLDNQESKGKRRHRPHLLINVEASTLGTGHLQGTIPATGMTLTAETMERIMCECDMPRVMRAAGEVLDLGRTTHSPSAELYRAVVARDEHCRVKGCDRPASWCNTHHVRWWERDKGITSLGNLVLLCRRHHTMLHRPGWYAELKPNGDFVVTTPRGEIWRTRPPRAVAPPFLQTEFETVAETSDPYSTTPYDPFAAA